MLIMLQLLLLLLLLLLMLYAAVCSPDEGDILVMHMMAWSCDRHLVYRISRDM